MNIINKKMAASNPAKAEEILALYTQDAPYRRESFIGLLHHMCSPEEGAGRLVTTLVDHATSLASPDLMALSLLASLALSLEGVGVIWKHCPDIDAKLRDLVYASADCMILMNATRLLGRLSANVPKGRENLYSLVTTLVHQIVDKDPVKSTAATRVLVRIASYSLEGGACMVEDAILTFLTNSLVTADTRVGQNVTDVLTAMASSNSAKSMYLPANIDKLEVLKSFRDPTISAGAERMYSALEFSRRLGSVPEYKEAPLQLLCKYVRE